MQKHNLVKLGEMKMQEADEWRAALARHMEEYYRAWLLERFAGELMKLVTQNQGPARDPKVHVQLSRIQMQAHDVRLDAEVNIETSKKLVLSSEAAARVYFEEHEQRW